MILILTNTVRSRGILVAITYLLLSNQTMGKQELRPQDLPDDVGVLKAIIIDQARQIEELKRRNERLEAIVHKLQRRVFGSSSETIPDEQITFPFVDTIDNSPREEEPRIPQWTQKSKPRKNGHGRRIIPPDLPRRREEIDISEVEKICTDCGGGLVRIGEEISEELDLEPEKVYVRQRARFKYACKPCETSVKIADLPPRIIEKGLAGPGLLAAIAIGKYADHSPLYRQEQIFARHGIEIPRSTMCGWIGQLTDQLGPLYKAMRKDVLKSEILNSDDTPMPVLEPGLGKTRKGRFWTYRGAGRHAHTVYEYTPDRKQEHVKNFLQEYQGVLQCDAYAGYKNVGSGKITLCGCWAHARRYFFEAKETDPDRAMIGMGYIRRLYQVEWDADEKDLDANGRRQLRQEYSAPILNAFKDWLDQNALSVLPRSPIGEAFTYARNQWDTLTRYTEDGRIPIDNNSSERAIKPVVLGRKNFLFFGSDEGGKRAAVMYTLIESAKQNEVEPWAYLKDVFERLPSHPMKRILDLAPIHWKKSRDRPQDTS